MPRAQPLASSLNRFVFLAAGFLIGESVGSASDADPRAAFLRQYEPHAKALLAHYANVQTRYGWSIPAGPDRKQMHRVSGQFNLSHYRLGGDTRLLELPSNKELQTSTSIDVRNTRYAFTVVDRGSNQYLLRSLEEYTDTVETPLCLLCFPYAFSAWRRTYLDIVSDPETTILNTKDVVWRDQKVKELQLECSFYHRGEKRVVRRPIAFYFAPSARWVCVGSHGFPVDRSQDSTYYEDVFTYELRGDWPVPVRSETWKCDERRADAASKISQIDIEEYTPVASLDESQFRLSVFGLPEPVGVTWPKPTPLYQILLFTGLACITVGVGFRWLGRRLARRQVPTPT